MSPELRFVAFLVGALAALAFPAYLQWRNERQLEDERRMRRGFPLAKRLGWIEDDVQ